MPPAPSVSIGCKDRIYGGKGEKLGMNETSITGQGEHRNNLCSLRLNFFLLVRGIYFYSPRPQPPTRLTLPECIPPLECILIALCLVACGRGMGLHATCLLSLLLLTGLCCRLVLESFFSAQRHRGLSFAARPASSQLDLLRDSCHVYLLCRTLGCSVVVLRLSCPCLTLLV